MICHQCTNLLLYQPTVRRFQRLLMMIVFNFISRLAKVLHVMGSGWYKVKVAGWTAKQQKAFCFEVEMETKF